MKIYHWRQTEKRNLPLFINVCQTTSLHFSQVLERVKSFKIMALEYYFFTFDATTKYNLFNLKIKLFFISSAWPRHHLHLPFSLLTATTLLTSHFWHLYFHFEYAHCISKSSRGRWIEWEQKMRQQEEKIREWGLVGCR